MHGPMKLLICLGVFAANGTHAANEVSSSSSATGWKLTADRSQTGRPVQRRAKDLFASDLRPTPKQLRMMARMDAVEFELEVKELRAAEIITAIQNRLADTPASDLVIRAEPSLASLEARFTFAQSKIRLSDALWLLRMGDTVRFQLRDNEVVAVLAEEAK